MSINKTLISGNLTRDPELRVTGGGTQVLGFGVAVNDRRRDPQTGEWEDHPNFVDCTIFGNRAEAMARILRKGMKVAVEGKLRYSSWQASDGSRRSKLEVVVDEIDLMQQAQRQAGYQPAAPAPQPAYPQQAPSYAPRQVAPAPAQPAYAPQAPAQQPAPRQAQQPPAMDLYDEDIPF